MKNKLVVKILGNAAVSKALGTMGSFYIAHRSTILTTGTIGFSWAATGMAMKNSAQISYILADYRAASQNCNTKEERNHLCVVTLKELIPLVAPIIIFEAAATTFSIFSKKHTDKLEAKLAETAGALSIAQAAIAQYQSFQKEAEQALGEEKYSQIQEEIYGSKDVDGKRFTAIASEGAPGETLFIDKYSGRPFWCSYERIRFAASRISDKVRSDSGYYDGQVTINDYYNEIENPDLTPNELGERFGYIPDVEKMDITAKFVDTHFIFPNGTRVQAAEVYLYPEPDYIG